MALLKQIVMEMREIRQRAGVEEHVRAIDQQQAGEQEVSRPT